jgi:hypothetical protein
LKEVSQEELFEGSVPGGVVWWKKQRSKISYHSPVNE